MILQKLIEHSKTLDLPTSFYSPTEVKYVFDINVDDVQNIKTRVIRSHLSCAHGAVLDQTSIRRKIVVTTNFSGM